MKRNEKVTMPCLCYHLSELKNAGIIEVFGYVEQKGHLRRFGS